MSESAAFDRSTKHLRKDHANFEIAGKPAVVFNHMQVGLAGGGSFTKNWSDKAKRDIDATGFVPKCRELAEAFRAKGLPVVFVNAIPDPFGILPVYGDLPNELRSTFGGRGYPRWFTDEWYRKGLEVMPEMGLQDTDYVLFNWLVHPFTCSGLDLVLRANHVDTIVWAGYAQHSACTTATLVAADYWFNNILPVDASPVIVPGNLPEGYEGLDDLVAEVTVKVQAAQAAHCTDTATVLEKLESLKF
ncbi:MAG: cysteine hydrolase [Clostridiales bacterium]|nr:cysteine hydrolase [Clostridiales bacterium]